ncbi:MAG TPA: response regulator [Burkholderiales bacterium]|nr:response regulator [Burkholderiales bacterium]
MNLPLKDAATTEVGHAEELSAIHAALVALRRGDPAAKLPIQGSPQFSKVADVFNDLVEQNVSMAEELSKLSQAVGKEGKLKRRASLPQARGFWAQSVENINALIDDLVHPTNEAARVIGAVAQGDLSKSMALEIDGRPLEGEFLRNAKTINKMVEQLGNFAAEVTRVAREVGTEGKLGGQAKVKGVAGVWKDLTDNVNSMAGNLTSQVRNIADVTTAVAKGDLSKKIEVDVKGEFLTLKSTINTMVDQLRSFAAEVTRVAREVGTEGILGGQARVEGVSGTWKDLTDSVNSMAGNLTSQVRNIADVTKAVQAGDLSKKITVDVKGEVLELKNTINTMVDQLRSFAAEVTRVAREVGTEGRLGGQADVQGVSGVWKDLTDNVNSMAGNLTSQVRGIAKVVTAVANGDLKQKLTVEAKGEIAALAETINNMTDTLATFADQVTAVAREVGVEGKLGGQAKVPGAAGTWKDLTENVNELAANLTTQVRAIAEVATAVTQGDLTRSISVESQGEVAALRDTINEMIRNLKDTTQKNTEQDWLKTNLAKFSRLLQGQRDLMAVGQMILSELAPVVGAQQAEFYVLAGEETPKLKLLASFASGGQGSHGKEVDLGEGLVGQCAIEKRKLMLSSVPSSGFRIATGLSEQSAADVLVLPVIFEGQVRGVIELASLDRFNPAHQAFLDQLTESIGIVINTIEANTRTENLLKQSQSLAVELQQTNEELQEKARLLAHQNEEVERKNREVELARQALEEKAAQLALTSKYKSEFLANMSHELRTPLNNLLILSDQLSRNTDGNLNPKQVEFAKTIHGSGNELLALIADILDLSKIESGTVAVEASELRFDDLQRYVERTFRHVAETKKVDFRVSVDPALPRTMLTDIKRLQQIIKNLLSNAFKFTHVGHVSISIAPAVSGWSTEAEHLEASDHVIAFKVSDTGIGISTEKQQIIFEAFQQADGSTSRKYGGTGLGLAISRELSKLLGGEIRLVSAPGAGSVFTLYLPLTYTPLRAPRPRPAVEAAQPQQVIEPVDAISPPEVEEEASVFVNEAGDDRDDIQPGDRVLLIVENDIGFAKILLDAARLKGFKGVVSTTGAAALAMIREYQPAVMTLDIYLPDMQGWRVLERLKSDLATRHIPVCVVSTDDARDRALNSGALGFISKPLTSRDLVDQAIDQLKDFVGRNTRQVLLMMPESAMRTEVVERLGAADIGMLVAWSKEEATRIIKAQQIDCLVIDESIKGLKPRDVLEALEQKPVMRLLPVVFFGAQGEEMLSTWRAADGTFALREARTTERLLDYIYFFVHRSTASMSEDERKALEDLHSSHRVLERKRALLVDDDMRNIFALATVLDEEGMNVVSANNGREAIEIVKRDPNIDIVLMDIMMPEMDGITTIKEIRKLDRGSDLPIIAVTAKAMKGDREKCIAAGAWDYLSKPVDRVHMLSVLRGWLHR